MNPMLDLATHLPSNTTDPDNEKRRDGSAERESPPSLQSPHPLTHAVLTVVIALLATIALGIIQMPDAGANASVTTINDDLLHPQAQSNVLPTITIKHAANKLGYVFESAQAAPFILTRSDATAGTLTVDLRVTQGEFGGYVANADLGLKTVTLDFGADGTARYEVPTLIRSNHEDSHVGVEIVADSTDPAEYTIGDPSSARVTILHQHEATPTPPPTGTPDIEYVNLASIYISGPSEAVPEGSDATFTISGGCDTCGDLTVSLRVVQEGDYVDIDQYDSHDEDEHDHDEDEDSSASDAFRFQTVTIPDGIESATFSLSTVDDDIVEADGRIIVILLAAAFDDDSDWLAELPSSVSDRAVAATIKSDDPPVVTVSTPDASAITEGDDFVIQLHRTGPMELPEILVRVQLADPGHPRPSRELTLTIPRNHVSKTFALSTYDDAVDQEHRSVTLIVLADTADPAAYRVGAAYSATVVIADNDPLDLQFDDPDDASTEMVPITDAIPVTGGDRVTYTLKMSMMPTSDVTVRIESDNPGVTVQPSQIIFSQQSSQTSSISRAAMHTSDQQASVLTVPWDHPATVNVIPKQGVTSGRAKLTHQLNCLVEGPDCGYSDAEEHIFVQVVPPLPPDATQVVPPPPPDATGNLIYRIEPKIRSVTVSTRDEVVLTVNIFGLQHIQDQSLGTGRIEWRQGNSRIEDYTGARMTYTAPSAPGTFTVNARVNDNACIGDSDDCSAQFEIRVRRPSPTQPQNESAVNPAGEIPSVIVDADGNQYEVFTPEQGGKFETPHRYSIAAEPGAVPNDEIVGVRMSEGAWHPNLGMTQHRYTLGGNTYAIHVIDAAGNKKNTYQLDDPAEVCIPLPHELRSNISKLALVSLNNNDALTILSARVRLASNGPSVCGNLSGLPATVAVGTRGAPTAILSPTPEPAEKKLPETGAPAPSSNTAAWILILGMLIAILMSATIVGRVRDLCTTSGLVLQSIHRRTF